MSLNRLRWLAAVCLTLGITPLTHAQQPLWRPVAQSSAPIVIATSDRTAKLTPPPSTSPLIAASGAPAPRPLQPTTPSVALGHPLPLPASPKASSPQPTRWVAARTAGRSGAIIRGQAPDLDAGSPYPPPLPVPNAMPVDPPGGTAGFAPYTAQDAGRFNAPTMPGVVIPLADPGAAQPVSPAVANPNPISSAVTIGLPHAQVTQTVSATVPVGGGPIDPPPPSSAEVGTAPPQPTRADITPHSVSNPPDIVPPPGGGLVPAPDITPGMATDNPVAPSFWEKCRNWFTIGDRGTSSGRCAFQSDHSFEGMVSPITMPFYFEDPRSLTEVRPIFLYQGIPGKTTGFGGGDAFFFGTQARVAITERFSIVMSELGFLSLNPKTPQPPVQNSTGFSEIKIGPKYTFWRDAGTGTLAAAGVNFELPVGSQHVFQNTGSFNLDPYLSFGQTFGRLPGGFGSFNFLSTTGYSFSANKSRSEFFYSSYHLDYNIANANKFFPLIELNWIHYTKAGTANNFGTEGADLINFGSTTRAGANYISLAGGFRYRFNEHIQAGTAVQFPLTNERGLSNYRLTFDVIFRY